MKILWDNLMMQRYRALLHVLDNLVEEGHKVYLREHGTFDLEAFRSKPMDVSCASPQSLQYLNGFFGLHVKHLSDVKWNPPSSKSDYNLFLSCEYKNLIGEIPSPKKDINPIKYGKTPPGQVNLPHTGLHCYTPSGPVLVGSGMSYAIKETQKFTEEKNQVLIIHPGGGRGIISPIREYFKKWDIVANNIEFLNKVLSYIPSDIEKVLISTHCSPFSYCDVDQLRAKVIPQLESDCEVYAVRGDIVSNICSSKYILTFGSSTSTWLLGSPKRWANVIDCSRYNLDSIKRRDTWEWTEDWFSWPQNIPFEALGVILEDYDLVVSELDNFELKNKYQEIYNLDFPTLVMEVIRESK